MKRIYKFIILGILLVSLVSFSALGQHRPKRIEVLKREFIELRFGMFICYNIMTYGAKWSEPNYPIDSFNPQQLDCDQWADAAVSAGMKFGLLTTKHHEGFCLWDSQYTEYDVAATPYQKDIVRQYVDAFRKKGLRIGLYYSIWDSTNGVDKGCITDGKMDLVKGQITELLSNYGQIDYFVIDGWFWRMGHHEVAYHEIRALIKQLQPDCLISEHTHIHAPYHLDIPYFEGPFGAFPQETNTLASAIGHCSVKGNGWFWGEKTPNGMKKNDGVDVIVDKLKKCESRYCNFMLNCMPNRQGLLDPLYMDLLKEIGEKWKADPKRPPLPPQGPLIAESVPIKTVTATSGNPTNLYDATKIPGDNYYHWQSDSSFPQEIVIDLGKIQKDIDVLTIVQNHQCRPGPEKALPEGNMTQGRLFVSKDNINYEEVAFQKWPKDDKHRAIGFKKSNIRFLKLEILEVNGNNAIIAELEVGRSSMSFKKN